MYQQQNYGYYPQTSYVPRAPLPGLKGRPVASIEEARASAIDFDGSVFYFPDLANKRIYTKQITMDGSAVLNMYELKEIPVEQPLNQQAFVTRDEFQAVIAALQQKFDSNKQPPVQIKESANLNF